ncbi:MAG TPA: GNAT family N-acetyltransferase, partial [Actinotalea sp.]|nr:GNAT family N-acetyltransferase [Actinotalea sp.]
MSWTVTAAPAPDALAHPGAWAVHGASAVSHAVDRANWGHTDAAWTARALLTRLHEQTYAQRLVLVATAADGLGRADAVVGFAELTMPNQGNDHAAYLDVFVHPEHRGAGAGPALLAAGEALADR